MHPAHLAEAETRLECHLSETDIPAVSPLHDPNIAEAAHFGHGPRIMASSSLTGEAAATRPGLDYPVAFTFDDGPKHTTTPRVLDALTAYNVPATFFVVGWRFTGNSKNARKNLEVLRDTVARGFTIGNHTYRHNNLTQIKPQVMRREISLNQTAIRDSLGFRPFLFRPPYGATSKFVQSFLHEQGYTEVIWNIDTSDWVVALTNSLRKRTLAQIVAKRGGVVLMHDTKIATSHQIRLILDDLEAENCRRVEAEQPLLIPVSLHYFMRNTDGAPRQVPADVVARTNRYRTALPARCQTRIDKSKGTP